MPHKSHHAPAEFQLKVPLPEGQEIRLRGLAICSGIAIGYPFFYDHQECEIPRFILAEDQIETEIERYRKALEESEWEVKKLQEQLEFEGAVEGASILAAHLQIMKDPFMTTHIEDQVKESKTNIEYLFFHAIGEYEKKFNALADPFFRERVKDLKDISRRILGRLNEVHKVSLADVPHQSIVFAHELVPSDTAEAESSRIGAFVTEVGGHTSHTAIMAKARGIPYVASVDFRAVPTIQDYAVIVDGRTGEVIINPTATTLSKYEELQKQLALHLKRFERSGQYAAETIDGLRIGLSANIEMFHEIEMVHRYGGSGIGLFRSEYICLSHKNFPPEEEQFTIYRRLVDNMKGLPVVIRTFDVGGDKMKELSRLALEVNPCLGCRALRFMLKEQDIFKTQLKAILRASAYGDVRILFPMVTGLPELLEAKQYLAEAKAELTQQGHPFKDTIKVGCMIEVPSAALACEALARESDFLSIGTNDLVQYTLAVDRGNQALSYLYTPSHPSVLRLIKMVVVEATRQGIPVSLCGEVAADPRYTSLLLGLGIQELSVAARYLPVVKNAIRMNSIVQSTRLAERVLSMPTAMEVLDALIEEYQKNMAHAKSYS